MTYFYSVREFHKIPWRIIMENKGQEVVETPIQHFSSA